MIRLCEPDIGHDEINAVNDVLMSGYLVQGKYVRNFEEKIESYLGVKHAIAVSSGTAALHLSLISIGIGAGDEVIVPDFTFPATANVVELVGAKPVFIDISLGTFNIDTTKIASCINKNTKAIMPVHEFGLAVNMDDIMQIAKEYGVYIVEDAACALGTTFDAKHVGTIGDIGCFSLHPRKAVTTGEGGIIVTSNDELASKIRILRNHGILIQDNHVDFIAPGFNYRMTDIQGAIGCTQFEKLKSVIDKRRYLANLYNDSFKTNSNITIPNKNCDRGHTYQTYYVLIDKQIERDMIMCALRESGIECNYGAYPLHSLSYYKNKYIYDTSMYGNSTFAYNQGIALPLHSKMSESDIFYIIEKVNALTYNI